jgi:hypothetical protein
VQKKKADKWEGYLTDMFIGNAHISKKLFEKGVEAKF